MKREWGIVSEQCLKFLWLYSSEWVCGFSYIIWPPPEPHVSLSWVVVVNRPLLRCWVLCAVINSSVWSTVDHLLKCDCASAHSWASKMDIKFYCDGSSSSSSTTEFTSTSVLLSRFGGPCSTSQSPVLMQLTGITCPNGFFCSPYTDAMRIRQWMGLPGLSISRLQPCPRGEWWLCGECRYVGLIQVEVRWNEQEGWTDDGCYCGYLLKLNSSFSFLFSMKPKTYLTKLYHVMFLIQIPQS